MKKTTLTILTGLIISSLSSFAQSKPVNLLAPAIKGTSQAIAVKTPTGIKQATPLHHLALPATHAPVANTPTKLTTYVSHYDSIYEWVWDTNTANWTNNVPDAKAINITYDAHGNILSETVQLWNSTTSKWVNDYLYTYTYNSANKTLAEIYQTWSGTAWTNSDQYSYTYDVHNNELTETYQTWVSGAWANNSLYTYTYDANNNQLTQEYQTWVSGAWSNSYLYTYTYNSNNNELTEEYETGSGSTWTPSELYSYYYNSNYTETSEIYQTWSGSVWVNSYQYVYTYNSGNYITNEVEQSWSVPTSAWVNAYQYNYTYNSSNEETNELEQNWVSSAWVNVYQYFYTYDANKNNTSEQTQQWVSGAWINYYQYVYTYNSSNDETLYLYQVWTNSAWANSQRSNYTYDADNLTQSIAQRDYNSAGTKVTSGDSLYYYFTDALGVTNVKAQAGNVTVYPNPSNGNFAIRFSNASGQAAVVEVYNTLGEKVYTAQFSIVNSPLSINMSNQANGIYLYRVIAESGTLLGEGRLAIQK